MRLIDADALIAKFDKRADWGICQIISKEPTVDALEQIRNEIVEEQSNWREDADAEWHECRRILRIINKYMK